jgi:hypothetical protein
MRRLTHWIILGAFVFSCGGQWAAFQVVAWANMIREYSQMVPLTQAVEITFSGQYPCEICKAIAERKSTEQQKELMPAKYDKQYLIPLAATAPAQPVVAEVSYAEPRFTFSSRGDSPPTPPPRDALS